MILKEREYNDELFKAMNKSIMDFMLHVDKVRRPNAPEGLDTDVVEDGLAIIIAHSIAPLTQIEGLHVDERRAIMRRVFAKATAEISLYDQFGVHS